MAKYAKASIWAIVVPIDYYRKSRHRIPGNLRKIPANGAEIRRAET
jgi:hypothetical protein